MVTACHTRMVCRPSHEILLLCQSRHEANRGNLHCRHGDKQTPFNPHTYHLTNRHNPTCNPSPPISNHVTIKQCPPITIWSNSMPLQHYGRCAFVPSLGQHWNKKHSSQFTTAGNSTYPPNIARIPTIKPKHSNHTTSHTRLWTRDGPPSRQWYQLISLKQLANMLMETCQSALCHNDSCSHINKKKFKSKYMLAAVVIQHQSLAPGPTSK